MPASVYADQFPWEKVDAAKRYLYLVKPWWARFGERLKIVPVYQPPPEGKPYGAITSTDGGFRLYIDTGFASWAPLHLLAGAIEHEFQHHTRDSWNRLTWLSLDEWREWANIAFDLEINSAIEHECKLIDMGKVRALAEKSSVFVEYELDFWSVTEPPGLGEEGWLPRLMGLPDRLSAEEYLKTLQMAKQDPPPPPPSPEDEGGGGDDGGDGGESGDQDEDESSSQGGSNGSSDSEGSENGSDDADGDGEGAPSEDSDGEEGDSNPDDDSSEDDAREDGESDKPSDDGDGERANDSDGETGSDAERPDDSAGDPGEPGQPEGDEEGEEGDGDESEPGDPSDSADRGSQPGGDGDQQRPGAGGTPKPSPAADAPAGDAASLAEAFAELSGTGDRRMWSAELANPKDELIKPAWKPDDRHNEKALDRASVEGALIELEEDIRQCAKDGNDVFGLHPGANMLQWAAKRRRVRGVDWQSKLNRLLSSNFNSAKTHGASDLSYAVRNPNQPEFGVILQGLHDYAPNITVIQDVSGSMIANDGLNKAMSAFTDLCSKVLGRFNSPVTWVTVDAGIIDVGKASSWTKHQQKRWSYGFGGTDIAPAIEQVMTGKLVWDGRKYPKADLTVISTDCIFEWPTRRPIRNGRLLVVSVEPDLRKLDKFLPSWLDRRRELVVIDD